MPDEEELKQARRYDEMIDWAPRLEREIPVISKYLPKGRILDVACSSGRHSFALEELGYEPIGVDNSESMIHLARQAAEEANSSVEFAVVDASSTQFVDMFMGEYFDGAILLGNAIANMGSRENAEQLLRNIFLLLKPDGKFFTQTIYKPKKPHYVGLRWKDNQIVQRIMVPIHDDELDHNVELHVNMINTEPLEYQDREADNQFYMFTREELEQLFRRIGFEVEGVYSGYSKEEVKEVDGETLIWEVKKPEMSIRAETLELFDQYADMSEETIIRRALDIWQEAMLQHWYHCIRDYRFLYPRISFHPRFEQIKEEKIGGNIVDIGCNLGTDLRKLIVEGAEPSKLHGIDIDEMFWELGYKLYEDENDLAITFHEQDVTSDEFLNFDDSGDVSGEFSSFGDNFDLVHSGSLVHLLTLEEDQTLFNNVYYLLQPGGIFFGRTVGNREPQDMEHGLRYLHNVETLSKLMENIGYVDIDVQIMNSNKPDGKEPKNQKITLTFYGRKPEK